MLAKYSYDPSSRNPTDCDADYSLGVPARFALASPCNQPRNSRAKQTHRINETVSSPVIDENENIDLCKQFVMASKTSGALGRGHMLRLSSAVHPLPP